MDSIRRIRNGLAKIAASFALLCGLTAFSPAQHQGHLYWQAIPGAPMFFCLYGEIEVLATAPTTYFCGMNWSPGEVAGGYTGVQDLGDRSHVSIYSIWDPKPEDPTRIVEALPGSTAGRFGGEGTGVHVLIKNTWQVQRIYRYFVVKRQDDTGTDTLAREYFFDDRSGQWIDAGTFFSPNDGPFVKSFHGDLESFIENFGGQRKEMPRVALFRVWFGASPSDMLPYTTCKGDGLWGTLGDSFFIASGDEAGVSLVLHNAQQPGDSLVPGGNGSLKVPAKKLSPDLVKVLEKLAN